MEPTLKYTENIGGQITSRVFTSDDGTSMTTEPFEQPTSSRILSKVDFVRNPPPSETTSSVFVTGVDVVTNDSKRSNDIGGGENSSSNGKNEQQLKTRSAEGSMGSQLQCAYSSELMFVLMRRHCFFAFSTYLSDT